MEFCYKTRILTSLNCGFREAEFGEKNSKSYMTTDHNNLTLFIAQVRTYTKR